MPLTENEMQEITPTIEAYIDSRSEANSARESITEHDLFHKIKKSAVTCLIQQFEV